MRSASLRPLLLALAFALIAAVPGADVVNTARADRRGIEGGVTQRYPSDDIPDPAALSRVLQGVAAITPATIVFERGTHRMDRTLTVFRSAGIQLCGATGKPGDVEILFPLAGTRGLIIEQSRNVQLRDLTITHLGAFGRTVTLRGQTFADFDPGAGQSIAPVDSLAEEILIRNCRMVGFAPVEASTFVRFVTLDKCRLTVTRVGGIGLVWEDGPGLFVRRCEIGTDIVSPGPGQADEAATGIFVRGNFSDQSTGGRVTRTVLSRNRIEGDFAVGIDIGDPRDTRIKRNKVLLPESTTALGQGRIGVRVRRISSSQLPSDVELLRNKIRNAHLGIVFLDVREGALLRNDVRECGTALTGVGPEPETGGAAVQLRLSAPNCRGIPENAEPGDNTEVILLRLERNDFRKLRSDLGEPAVSVAPEADSGSCFTSRDRNKVDRGRELYEGEATAPPPIRANQSPGRRESDR